MTEHQTEGPSWANLRDMRKEMENMGTDEKTTDFERGGSKPTILQNLETLEKLISVAQSDFENLVDGRLAVLMRSESETRASDYNDSGEKTPFITESSMMSSIKTMMLKLEKLRANINTTYERLEI